MNFYVYPEGNNMYDDLTKKLKANTEIMENTFQKFNLKILHYTYRPYFIDEENDADCELIMELASVSGGSISEDAQIKINLYDADGEIILSEDCYIDSEEFDGYDTIKFDLSDNGKTLIEAKSAKIFVTR